MTTLTVRQALEAYDAKARQSPLLGVIHDDLRQACMAAGMPKYPFSVVRWARGHVAGAGPAEMESLGTRQP